MMRRFADSAFQHAIRDGLIALATALLIAACGTGAAAFAGVLPRSEGVAAAVTATPLEDAQTALAELFK